MDVYGSDAEAERKPLAAPVTLITSLSFALVVAVAYLMTLSKNQGVAEDALVYVLSVNAGWGPDLFHPNHLLYNFAGWLGLKTAEGFGYSGDALLVMQVMSALAGAAAIGVVHSLSMQIIRDRALSAIISLACAGSYAFWWYSVEADTYIIPLLFVLIAGRIFLGSLNPENQRRVFVVGGLLALAALFHQQHVFSAVAFALTAFVAGTRPIAERFVHAASLLAVSGGLTLALYLFVGWSVLDLAAPLDVIAWAQGHAANGLWTPFSATAPIKALLGLVNSVYGLDFVFSLSWVSDLFSAAFPTTVLIEERFLASRLHPSLVAVSLSATVASAIAGVWLLTRSVILTATRGTGEHIDNDPEHGLYRRQAASLFVLFLIVQSAIVMIWHPLNVEFWIAVLPFTYVLVGMGLSRSTKPAVRLGALVFAGGLSVSNLAGTILPQTDRANDYWFVQNVDLLAVLKPGDLVVTEGGYVSNSYVRYFGPPSITVVTTGRMPLEEVDAAIEAHSGRVVFSSWALAPPDFVLNSGQLIEWDPSGIVAFDEKYTPKLRPLAAGDAQSVWVVEK